MYIQKITIKNIRSIVELEVEFAQNEYAGWHVLIGENGSGKSTIIRSIALTLIGPKLAPALRLNWEEWLSNEQNSGSVVLQITHDIKFDKISSSGRKASTSKKVNAIVRFERESSFMQDTVNMIEETNGTNKTIYRQVWGTGAGWFSASYGPFRRFRGGNEEYAKLYYSKQKVAAHLSAFGEDVALSEVVEWLKDLKFKALETQDKESVLEKLTKFVNQKGFLPYNAQLRGISSDGVRFEDGNGSIVSIENLSDGYRSILSMTFELIRQLQISYPDHVLFSEDCTQVVLPGVVLIDEIDVHLHPTWQRRIGFWLQQHFPNIQFIVTTHSPLVCQAAEKGSVWKLPAPGSDERCQRVQGQELDRLLYGNILEAYGTELFGLTDTRSDDGKEKLHRLAMLNIKEVFEGISEAERSEQESLRAALPAESSTLPSLS